MPLLTRALRLLREERGIALVLSLFMLIFFGMVVTTLIHYTTANTNSASRHRADQQAFALAEAGLNDAISSLASDPTNPDAIPGTPTAATLTGATYKGSVSGNRWTLTGAGSVRNSAGSSPVTRQVSQDVEIFYTPDTNIWDYLYSEPTGCMVTKNNAVITSPLYVRGNLCISNNANITGSPLQVEGTLTIGNNGSVGYSNAPIAVAKLKGGCTGGNPNPHPCTSADRVYANSITTTTDDLTKPQVDLAAWYQNSSPGPMHNCTSGSMPGGFDTNGVRDGSRPTFNLAPSTSYSCSTSSGQISWTPGNPGTLTVSGVIFFDGNILVDNGNAVYSGKATIYSSGTVSLDNSARLCGIVGCTSSWNTEQNVLMFVAGASSGYGFDLKNNSVYQGAAYTVADYHLDNNSVNWGPVVANKIQIDNNSDQSKPLMALSPGAPGTTPSVRIVPASYSG